MAGHGKRLTAEILHHWCDAPLETLSPFQAFDIAVKLGTLAVWWLRPEVLQRAAHHAESIGNTSAAAVWRTPPRLPGDCGSCWVALVNRWNLPLLEPALPLVLRWAKDEADDPCLPAGLIEIAEAARREVKDDPWFAKPGGADSWGLQAAHREELDLRDLDGQWDSAWAPLAAGLLLAAAEGSPDPAVWASGSWRTKRGIQGVEGIDAKMALARRLGATVFFLPKSQMATVGNNEVAGLDLGALPEGHLSHRDALRDYLDRLDIEPGRDAPPEKRRDRYLRFVDNDRAKSYYEDYILDDVIERCRLRLPRELQQGKPHILVTIVSDGYVLPVLAARLLRPDHCLLLHDAGMADNADRLLAQIEAAGIREASGGRCHAFKSEFAMASRDDLVSKFQAEIDKWIGPSPQRNLVVDLTPGKRIMNLALYDAMPNGSYAFCIQAEFDPRVGRPKPFSEDVFCWPVTRPQSP